jgi:DNA-binding SARP family transcriptional activator/predicted ATPase
MAALELRFLGDLEVVRDGATLPLPPSRKTRALLAYLALNRRSFSREHLCDLLWDVSDDPRGSLRWSLTKLRRLVDDDAAQRIVADRNSVAFDAAAVAIDSEALKTLSQGELGNATVDALEAVAARYRGHFLEGLSLPDFQVFDTWCVSEREAVTAAQCTILRTLVRRLATQPERAVGHARALATLAPYDEPVRAALIRLLVALGRRDQAEQQYGTGLRMLKEAGVASSGALYSAWRGTPGSASAPHAEPGSGTGPTGTLQPAAAVPAAPTGLLIGRDAEIERIAAALRATIEQSAARVILVSGEPGIGKSRLLEAASALARDSGAALLDACAFESEGIRPFALWIDALQRFDPETSAGIFGGDHTNRERLFAGLNQLVDRRTCEQPLVLMFDDLQWADESSAAALHYVTRMSRARPLLGVLAARADELRDNTPVQRAVRELRMAGLLEEIELGPLGEDALRALISLRAPEADRDRLSRACGGNPLLAIELARAESAGDSGRSLGELIEERLARFDIEGGDLLRWAAVLAPRIDATTLARVTGLDWNRIGEILETAARQAMLQPAGRSFRFPHDLIARGIYAGISPARRRTMHRRVAEYLEQETAADIGHAADLAHHATQSGDVGLAARAMVSAGRLCLRFFANDEALTLARRGLGWVEQLPPPERVCLTLELHEIMLAAAPVEDREAAASEYAELAEQALDHGAFAHARRGYFMASYVRWMQGEWAAARDEILQSERVARAGNDREHVIGMAEAARCLAMLERDLTHADAMLMEAQALAARQQLSHYAIPAALGMLRFHENHLDEAAGLFKEARTLAKSAGERLDEFQALEYLVILEFERGDLAAAQAYCVQLGQIGEKLREGSERPFAHALDGLCRYAVEDDAAPIDAALDALRSVDAKHRLAYTLTRAAQIEIERGRPMRAIERAGEALSYAETLGRATETLLAHLALLRAYQEIGDMDGQARHAAALASLDDAPVAKWARERAVGARPARSLRREARSPEEARGT